jgi:hypothetical protein
MQDVQKVVSFTKFSVSTHEGQARLWHQYLKKETRRASWVEVSQEQEPNLKVECNMS